MNNLELRGILRARMDLWSLVVISTLVVLSSPTIAQTTNFWTRLDSDVQAGATGGQPSTGPYSGGFNNFAVSAQSNAIGSGVRFAVDNFTSNDNRALIQSVQEGEASVQGFADFGTLRAFAESYGKTPIRGYGFGPEFGGPQSAFNSDQGYGSALMEAQFRDIIVLSSATLPVLTPVQLQFQFSLHGASTTNSDVVTDLQASTEGSLSVYNETPDFAGQSLVNFQVGDFRLPFGMYTGICSAHVGDIIYIDSDLQVDAEASTSQFATTASASADASNTALMGFSVLTPGVSYSAESGTVYPTSLPEPTSLSLLGLSSFLILGRRKRD